jgi:hypothetical protein
MLYAVSSTCTLYPLSAYLTPPIPYSPTPYSPIPLFSYSPLDFKARWEELQHHDTQDLLHLGDLGMEDAEALLDSQRDRLQSIRAATEQDEMMDTVDKLRAASCNPTFEVDVVDGGGDVVDE